MGGTQDSLRCLVSWGRLSQKEMQFEERGTCADCGLFGSCASTRVGKVRWLAILNQSQTVCSLYPNNEEQLTQAYLEAVSAK